MRLLTTLLAAGALLIGFCGCDNKKEKPDKFALEVTSNPAGAKVWYKGKERGVTPVSLKAAPGLYRMRVEKDGYTPEWVLLKVSNAPVQQTVNLKPVTACVLITSTPSEAQVDVDGVMAGETPLILKNQQFGHHRASIKKLGFVTQQVSWDVRNGRPQAVSANMSSDIGYLVIESSPENAAVTINNQPSGTTPLRKELEQGKYQISITKEGFTTVEEQLIVTRNKTVTRAVQLQRLPGKLKITSTPAGATITVNGKTEGSTPLTLNNLKPGKYEVIAEKAGFDPSTQEIEISAGREIPLNFDLGSNTGGVDLAVNPPGVTVYLDGKEVGKAKPDEDGKFAKVFQLRGLSAGIHTITVAHKRAVPQQKVIKITVEKGKIARPKKINMWITNAELKLKSGRRMVGYLVSETPVEVFFEPEPGVRQGFRRDEIESLETLKEEE